MLFDRLSLHNFQRYAGDFEIRFPSPDKKPALVVVLAPNNTGKTTIIRALRFLLYGDLGTKTPNTVWELVNERVRASGEPGENLKAWVEARIRIGDREPMTIRRSLTIRRVGSGDKWTVEGPGLHFKKSDNAGEKFQKDDGMIQSRLRRAVPEDLFSWFYFHGEPAGGKMAHAGADGLRSSLQKVIQLQRWSDSIETVEALVTKIQRELGVEMGASDDYSRLLRQIETVQKGQKENKEGVKLAGEQEDRLEAEIEGLNLRIEALAKKAEKTEKILKEIQALEGRKQSERSKAERAAQEYRRLVSGAGGVPFLFSTFDLVDKRLAGLRKKNLLPADVSRGFIERLLKSPGCVCGRVHDDEAREHLQKYLETSLASQTNSDLLVLANRLDGASGSHYRAILKTLSADLNRLRLEEEAARRSISEIEKQLDEINPPDEGDLTGFQALLQERRKAEAKRSNLASERINLEATIRTQEQTIKRLRDELAKIAPKKKLGKVDLLNREHEKAKALLDALEKGQERFKESVASILQDQLAALFDPAVTSGNKARIDRRTLLPVIMTPGGQIERDSGGGEKQVLELAYVIALAELRTVINRTVREAGLGGNLLGPQSFILDSPFTSVDPNYMRVIAEFLPGKTQQMMLLVAKQNWHDTIRVALEDHITDAHAVTLHTSAEIKEPDAYSFEFRGKKLNLLKKLPGNVQPFTSYQQL
jgi:DNA sulfur modification protein DndD